MSVNFLRRILTTLTLAIVILATFFTHDAIGTKIFFAICATLAFCEWWTRMFYAHPATTAHIPVIIVGGAISICLLDQGTFGLVILTTVGYDIFAYIGGTFFGHSWFKKGLSPKTSINKTLEGFILGLLCSITLGLGFMLLWKLPPTEPLFIVISSTGGLLAALGDYIGSRYKRTIAIKDSDIPLTSHILPGHGGFIDRFLSHFTVALATVVLSSVL